MNKDDKYMLIHFANGDHIITKAKPDIKVKAIVYAPHGDWKTQSVRDDFMGMRKDETGDLIGIIENFYGMFCRVKREDGYITTIDPRDLEVIK
jgi:hypothetical protein